MEVVLSHLCPTDLILPDKPALPYDLPGILILSQDGRTRYFNGTAQKFLETIGKKPISHKSIKRTPLQKIILDLLLELKHGRDFPEAPPTHRIFLHQGTFYQVRSIPLVSSGKTRRDTYLLLLIETTPRNPRIDSSHRSPRLTEREKTLVMLLSEGRTNKDVAHCMGISEYTVKEHIRRIMRKLKVTTRVGIVAKLLMNPEPQKI